MSLSDYERPPAASARDLGLTEHNALRHLARAVDERHDDDCDGCGIARAIVTSAVEERRRRTDNTDPSYSG